MKRITLLFIALIACLITAAAQTDSSSVQPSVTETGIEYVDTPTTPGERETNSSRNNRGIFADLDFGAETVIPVIAIISVFGLPAIIVFIAFYFNYKNKRAKYKLAEQALASGQPIPENFFKESSSSSTLQKGITNTFTGIGLFIFLWAITSQFSIGCIGLLVMFTGIGQIVIHYTSKNKKEDTDNHYRNKDNNSSLEG